MSQSIARGMFVDRRSDPELILAIREADESALATLYDRHSAVILGVLLRLMRERADAESVLLETFLQVSRSADRFDAQRSNVRSWLMMIARTRALDALRISARQHALVPRSLDDLTVPELEALHASADAVDRTERQEQTVAVRRALRALPAAQREAIELAFFLGLTHPEIATRLGEPLGTVKSRIRGGLLKLREPLLAYREASAS
jgi:RNA polymerase sigma-70 factor, ECF subfamily